MRFLSKPENKSISLSIPQPCHEDWHNMTPNERGRYCTSCDKTVIDFSLYSDRELVDFFKNASGIVCGKLNNWQVNREIIVSDTNRSPFYKWFLGTALASWLGLAGTASAQSDGSQSVVKNITDSAKSKQPDTEGTIKGTLIDSTTHEPIPFANIELEYIEHGAQYGMEIDATTSDIHGNFSVSTHGDFVDKTLTLLIVHMSYKEARISLEAKKDSQTLKIGLSPMDESPTIIGIIIPNSIPDRSNPDKSTYHRRDTPYQ